MLCYGMVWDDTVWTFLSLSSALRLHFCIAIANFGVDLNSSRFVFPPFSTLLYLVRAEGAPVAGEVVPLSKEGGVVASSVGFTV